MKDNLELVEKLVEKTGISYTEAKAALEKADWDILEAIINLETEGKVKTGAKSASSFSTRGGDGNRQEKEKCGEGTEKSGKKKKCASEDFKKNTVGVFEWLRTVFDKGNSNDIEVYKNSNKVLGMPVTVFVLLIIVGFWCIIPLMVIGLFFGFRYRLSGPDLGKDSINDAIGKASDAAESIKQEFKNKDND